MKIEAKMSEDLKIDIQAKFDKCTSKTVLETTTAYYVYKDIEAGLDIKNMDRSRLVCFFQFLRKYELKHPKDYNASKLSLKVKCIIEGIDMP
jgi:hypothetical protein